MVVAENRTKCLRITWTSAALCQPSYRKPTTVKPPWRDRRKKVFWINYCTNASFPMKMPSFWHTTTCKRPQRHFFFHRQRPESRKILFPSQTKLSQLTPLGQEESVPVWRIQEWRWLTGIYPTTLWDTVFKYAQYAKYAQHVKLTEYANMQNMQNNMQNVQICKIYKIIPFRR